MKYYCDNCKKDIELDQNAGCAICGNSYLIDIVANILSEDSKCFLIFNADKESVNKADLSLPNSHINKGAAIVQITREFFNQLEAVVHDETPEGGTCGKVLFKNEPKAIQAILNELAHHAITLEKELGKTNSSSKPKTANNKQLKGQIAMAFDEEFSLYENMWTSSTDSDKKDLNESYRRTVSRGNSLIENDIFVDFD